MAFRLEYSTTAKCRPEHVWSKFERLEQWAWWTPVIGAAKWLDGERWQKGGHFYFELIRPRKMAFKPVIIESAPPHKLAWVGRSTGFRGEHWFSFAEQPDGTTLMKTWENFSGIGTLFIGHKLKDAIVKSYEEWFTPLKAEAEKMAREELARK